MSTTKNPTPAQLRALAILDEHTNITQDRWLTAAQFGSLAYPDTSGNVNGAWGLLPGAAVNQAAGSVLARLYSLGWVHRQQVDTQNLWAIKHTGRDVLRAAGTSHEGDADA